MRTHHAKPQTKNCATVSRHAMRSCHDLFVHAPPLAPPLPATTVVLNSEGITCANTGDSPCVAITRTGQVSRVGGFLTEFY